jgi:hypothetical protein
MSDETLPKFWDRREELDYIHKQIHDLREEVNRLRLIVTDVQDQISPDRDPNTGIPYGELN